MYRRCLPRRSRLCPRRLLLRRQGRPLLQLELDGLRWLWRGLFRRLPLGLGLCSDLVRKTELELALRMS